MPSVLQINIWALLASWIQRVCLLFALSNEPKCSLRNLKWFPTDVNTSTPDKKSIMMYVMCLYQALPHTKIPLVPTNGASFSGGAAASPDAAMVNIFLLHKQFHSFFVGLELMFACVCFSYPFSGKSTEWHGPSGLYGLPGFDGRGFSLASSSRRPLGYIL